LYSEVISMVFFMLTDSPDVPTTFSLEHNHDPSHHIDTPPP
jgi:hypothetical protein